MLLIINKQICNQGTVRNLLDCFRCVCDFFKLVAASFEKSEILVRDDVNELVSLGSLSKLLPVSL